MDHAGFSCRKESRVRLGLPNAPCAIGRSGIVHLVPSIGSRKFGNHAEGSRIRPSRRMFGQRRPPHPRRLTKWARMFMTASQESADPSSFWLLGNARKRRNVSRESLADAMNMRVPHLKLLGSTGRPRLTTWDRGMPETPASVTECKGNAFGNCARNRRPSRNFSKKPPLPWKLKKHRLQFFPRLFRPAPQCFRRRRPPRCFFMFHPR